jgi:hypothetical protein
MPEDPITPPGSEETPGRKPKTAVLVPVALPGSVVELAKYRKSKAKQSIVDECERVCLALWEVAEFQSYLKAFRDEDAVEGSIAADDFSAARMIREKAIEMEMPLLSRANLHETTIALRRVCNRYSMGRKTRREASETTLDAAE